jgi:riboflavin kinase/FMN adenylyltransferase
LAEKEKMIRQLGVERFEVLSFTKDFSSMTTEDYLRHIMKEYGATAILLGYDNRMGSDAADPDQVARKAEELGLEVIRTEMVPSEYGYAISSTKIREKIEDGDVEGAAENLELLKDELSNEVIDIVPVSAESGDVTELKNVLRRVVEASRKSFDF